jgi:membrane-bound lytic murein transglycosylase B
MNPTRDAPVFAQLTAALGLDPDKMPVSKRQWYGWGGAMGPAQFIPSTWVLYADKVGSLTGHHPPSPWDPQDAFMASGLLLADSGGATDERTAAICYLAGCKNAKKQAYSFYGNEVLHYASEYQNDIDILTSKS